MKKIFIIPAIAFLSSCGKNYFVAEQPDSKIKANYSIVGNISTGIGLRVYKIKIDSVDYIIVSQYNSGTSIIKHGLTSTKK